MRRDGTIDIDIYAYIYGQNVLKVAWQAARTLQEELNVSEDNIILCK